MATDLKLINAALTRIGETTISSLDDAAAMAQVATQNYEGRVADFLACHPWRFSTKVRKLNLIDEDEEGIPPEPWANAYQIPTDLLLLRNLQVEGQNVAFERMGDKLFCNVGSGSTLLATYTYRAPEADWPPYAREAFIGDLQTLFLRAREAYDEADLLEKTVVMRKMREARLRDSQGRTPRDPVTSTTLRARGGVAATSPVYPDAST